ncbi:type IX secretion system sortase PorU [Imperialibacter roseus]|uniref:Type IX secretion system sortase PorU n=1 Tax=Imperialibacter roseus TaxID=1324217 RepID=A0ABZ0IMX9_9BACT|nr:type IX secretion system sortase PorU [Imperialibacter roseus]WOK05519.1 type IX secretion system sortase PorU [Imperialibacter roseus]
MKKPIILIASLITFLACRAGFGQSVLSEGQWLKIGVTEKGVYKIDRDFLQKAGVDVSAIDPGKLAMYGNGGGGMLPQKNATLRPFDLIENSVQIIGEEDGRFDASDYLLFYGNSPHEYSFETGCSCFRYERNLYSDTTYYFLRIDGAEGKRMLTRESLGSPGVKIEAYDDLFAHEVDINKLGKSGRHWQGEIFSSSGNATLTFEGGKGAYLAGTEVTMISSVVTQSFGASSFDIRVNGNAIFNQAVGARGEGDYDPLGVQRVDTIRLSASAIGSAENTSVEYTYNRFFGKTSLGYLDYFFLQGKKKLNYRQGGLIFRNKDAQGTASYSLGNAAAVDRIWDVTEPTQPINQQFSKENGVASFTVDQTNQLEFIAVDPASLKSPASAKKLLNQELKNGQVPDLVIVAHKNFLSEANRLANFRRSNGGLDVRVVTVQQVYNEFSSGMQDISAIRDYMKYLYDAVPGKLKYLLLFGDASFDYKARTENHNFVPVYESRESLDQILSFSSDDYFAFLDDHEGEWVEQTSGDHIADIGVGRLPVWTAKQAAEVVDKIIGYSTDPAGVGSWRNDLYFVADDGDFNIHLRDADRLADYVDTAYVQFNIKKIYLDAFKQVLIESKPRSPETYEAIRQAVDNGAFIINYSGHGNATVLTDERIVVYDSLVKWKNGSRLALFVTATCEFGRYDDPTVASGAEELLLNPQGGAIALLTTTRPVYAHTNYVLNQAFYLSIFSKINGEYPRLGDVIRETKNNSLRGPVNRNFALLGDPSMRLNYPAYNLKITELNGVPIDGVPDTVSAMNKVVVKGIVEDGFDQKVTDYNGKLTVNMYDKPTTFATLGDESQPTNYELWNNVVYRGKVSITQGEFSYEFVVPKNISYQQTRGKITMYAQPESGLLDGNGATIDFYLGGSKPPAFADAKSPAIQAFINDDSFRSGDRVNANPLLMVKLADESGINISGKAIGQNITYQIDEQEPVILNDYYVSNLDDFTSGTVLYPLGTLTKGKHRLKVRAFDTFSNVAENIIDFVVSEDTKVRIKNVLSFPNPATESITFRLEHDRGDHLLSISMELVDQRGAVVDKMEWQANNSGGFVESPEWNRNYNGRRIENGIYIYRLIVVDEEDLNQNIAFGKLILTN